MKLLQTELSGNMLRSSVQNVSNLRDYIQIHRCINRIDVREEIKQTVGQIK